MQASGFPQLESSDGITVVDQTQIEQNPSKRPLSPAPGISFDCLPVEIASVIFEHYIHFARSDNRPHAPLTLGKICRRWRQIAWSTPVLWTQLDICHRHVTFQMDAELAEEWLERSGSLPLVIEYSSFCDPPECDLHIVAQQCKEMIQLFSRFSDRWHSIRLILPIEALGCLYAPIPVSPVHHLSLDGTWNDLDSFRNGGKAMSYIFSNCSPKIINISCLNIDVDWTSVTDLTLDFVPDIDYMLRIFQTATNLSKCTLKDVSDVESRNSTLAKDGSIICPVLESLSISFGDEAAHEIFCNSVSLPALKHLSILNYEIGTIDFAMEDFIIFLSQSLCALTSLVIDESDYEIGDLDLLLPFLSSLTDLKIFQSIEPYEDDDVFDSERFYRLLANPRRLRLSKESLPVSPSHMLPYLPCLETFSWEGPNYYPWKTLPGLLQPIGPDSMPYRRPLKSVKIVCIVELEDWTPYIPKDILHRLSEFRDVEFSFFTKPGQGGGPAGIDLWKTSTERVEERCYTFKFTTRRFLM